MQTIGQLLQSLRLQKTLTLADICEETRIAPHLLTALEADDFDQLPSSTFTKGFITNYARVVGLSSQKALAVFRRDFTVTESGKIMPKGLAKPLDKQTVIATGVLWTGGIFICLLAFLGYVTFQLRDYHAPPQLSVQRPQGNAIVKGPVIPVKGFVSADSSVYLNGSLTEVFPTGEFRATVQLPIGNQTIHIKAVNSQHKVTEKMIPVTVVDN